ncbi:hypothetical protein CEXT_174121 [Caerostris extrusa]|uniref:Uncharacterized protein n=1 Tax=Caerostris extrusa TaxID=172846 RepID=A0AAV4S206_CAEEX|nr:hypothetical protein CEXT_174121 [Caerostris extrusa]
MLFRQEEDGGEIRSEEVQQNSETFYILFATPFLNHTEGQVYIKISDFLIIAVAEEFSAVIITPGRHLRNTHPDLSFEKFLLPVELQTETGDGKSRSTIRLYKTHHSHPFSNDAGAFTMTSRVKTISSTLPSVQRKCSVRIQDDTSGNWHSSGGGMMLVTSTALSVSLGMLRAQWTSLVALFRRWYDACNKHCTLSIPRDAKNTMDVFSGTLQEVV